MASGRADHYRAALAALEQQKTDYLNQVNDLEQLIAGITRQITLAEGTGPSIDNGAMVQSQTIATPVVTATAFKGMSVRWGILKLLSERGPLTTQEIAKTLQAGGMESQADRFVGNVSAVISMMKRDKEEVESVDDGRYQLTNNGSQAWEHIRHSPKYRNRLNPI